MCSKFVWGDVVSEWMVRMDRWMGWGEDARLGRQRHTRTPREGIGSSYVLHVSVRTFPLVIHHRTDVIFQPSFQKIKAGW